MAPNFGKASKLLVTNFCTADIRSQRTRNDQWSHNGCPGIVWDYGNNKLGSNDRTLRYCGCWCGCWNYAQEYRTGSGNGD